MAVGTVKWFNNRKGYGFIQPSEGGRDVFVHISALEKAGLKSLNENENIEYQLVESRGKTVASDLKVIGAFGASDNHEHGDEGVSDEEVSHEEATNDIFEKEEVTA